MSRCPECGAHNPETAGWCGQCLARFERDPEPRSAEAAAPSSPEADRTAFPPVPPPPVPDGVEAGAFLTEGGAVRWRCPACETVNDLDDLVCAVCGTDLAAQGEPAVDWAEAKRRAVLAPGLGHLAAGHGAGGIARLILAGVWLLGALSLLVTGGLEGLLPAVPLLVGATALWFGAVLDLDRLSRGEAELITSRVLLWLVVGVFVLVLLTLWVQAPLPTGGG